MLSLPSDVSLETLYEIRERVKDDNLSVYVYNVEDAREGGVIVPLYSLVHMVEEWLYGAATLLEKCYQKS